MDCEFVKTVNLLVLTNPVGKCISILAGPNRFNDKIDFLKTMYSSTEFLLITFGSFGINLYIQSKQSDDMMRYVLSGIEDISNCHSERVDVDVGMILLAETNFPKYVRDKILCLMKERESKKG